MARYFSQNLRDLGDPPTPSTEALIGMQAMERSRAEAAMRAQDKVAAQSRRIVARVGLNGDDAWLVPNTGQTPNAAQTCPLPNTPRSVAPLKIDVTPGCVLRAIALHLPSGMTSFLDGSTYDPAGTQGILHFVCTFTAADASTETYTYVMPLDGSTLENGSENTSNAGMQKSLRLAEVDILPPVDLTDLATKRLWSRPWSVEIEIRYVGSPRIIDCTVSEIPRFYAREADDTDNEWTQHIFSTGDPDGQGPKPDYPVDEREDTGAVDRDQRIGTLQCLRVAENQRKRFGPMLFHWVPYNEDDATINGTSLQVVTISTAASLRWANVLNTDQFATLSSAAAFEPDEPGWSMGCGGYARPWRHNNRQVIPTQNVATAPVLLRVLADNNAAATNTELRLHSAPDDATATSSNSEAAYSWISLTIPAATGGTPVWYEAWGFVTVGINPEQHVVAQLMVQQETSGTNLNIYAVEAYVWDGTYAPGG